MDYGARGFSVDTQRRCDRGCIAEEEEGWGWDGGENGPPEEPRLRALKSVCKRKITEKGLVRHMETELAVLKQCSHPFIVSLSPGGHFQTSRHLHLVLNYCPGGDLFSLLGRVGRLAEPQARVCAAQLALALRHLHDRHIAYRDLKPENVCIDAKGHAILVDFSLARTGLDLAPNGKAFTFCGSAAYAAPEVIAKEGHDTRVDLWSLGCVMFEALVGLHPFRRPRGERTDRQALFERIACGQPEYPPFLSGSALSFLRGLLVVNPLERLGFAPASCSSQQKRQQQQQQQQQQHQGQEQEQQQQRRRKIDSAAMTFSSVEPPPPTPPSPILARTSSNGSSTDRAAATRVDLAQSHRYAGLEHADGREGEKAEPALLLEHRFFSGLPGWGGPGSGGAWEDGKLGATAVGAPALRHALDVQYFDPRFTSQAVELALQGHPHKGGPTPSFEGFEWRADTFIEYSQVEERRAPGFLESIASALWC
ncbi:unnamed protein product [Laminaria digitata]